MRIVELLIATSNAGKLREIQALLSELPIKLLSLAELPGIEAVDETGSTFAENAALKAMGYARQTGAATLADDSGLVVDALGGAPGVYSARYLGEDTSYPERMNEILHELQSVPSNDRAARFVCALAVATSEGEIIFEAEAVCEGRIAGSPQGSGGFGYDPIFIPEHFDQTFAELPALIKNEISHRGRALAQAREFLRSLTANSAAG